MTRERVPYMKRQKPYNWKYCIVVTQGTVSPTRENTNLGISKYNRFKANDYSNMILTSATYLIYVNWPRRTATLLPKDSGLISLGLNHFGKVTSSRFVAIQVCARCAHCVRKRDEIERIHVLICTRKPKLIRGRKRSHPCKPNISKTFPGYSALLHPEGEGIYSHRGKASDIQLYDSCTHQLHQKRTPSYTLCNKTSCS